MSSTFFFGDNFRTSHLAEIGRRDLGGLDLASPADTVAPTGTSRVTLRIIIAKVTNMPSRNARVISHN